MTQLPTHQQAAVDGSGLLTPPWRRYFEALARQLASSGNSATDVAAQISAIARALGSPDGTVDHIPTPFDPASVRFLGADGVSVVGSLEEGLVTIRGAGSGSASMPAILARVSMRA